MEEFENEKIRKALSKVEVIIDDIYDLVNTKEPYPQAIPILIDLLSEVETDANKEGIIRALAVKEARGIVGKTLIKEYKRLTNKPLLKWVIGNTMWTVISKDDVDEVIDIVLDKSNGDSREMFVIALSRMKSEKVENVLVELLNDSDVTSHALESLGKLKSKKVKNKIEKLINHEKKLIRKEALKALKKIG